VVWAKADDNDDKPVTMQEGDADEEAEVDYCWFCEF
jgi:hypothetical protein